MYSLVADEFKSRAQELYAMFVEVQTGKSASNKALCCACIFEACKLLNAPRQLKEIDHAVAGEKSLKRDIHRAHKLLKKVQQQKGLVRCRQSFCFQNQIYHFWDTFTQKKVILFNN